MKDYAEGRLGSQKPILKGLIEMNVTPISPKRH